MSRLSHSELILAAAYKDLQHNWAETAEGWHDAARAEFEAIHLRELLLATKTAADAMGEISRLLDQAVRECA
jgi:hypothetical protein